MMRENNIFQCGFKADGQTLLVQFNLAGSITFDRCSETSKYDGLVFFVVGDRVFKGFDEGFGCVGLCASRDA